MRDVTRKTHSIVDHGGEMVGRERLIDAIYRVATGAKRTQRLLTPVGILFFGTFTTSFVLASLLVDHLLNLPAFLPDRFEIPLSIPFMLLGLVVSAWSLLHFKKAKGTPVPFNPPQHVVDTGPYRYSRNPMISGVILFLCGIGLLLNSISLVFFFLPLLMFLIVWELKRIEEPELIKRLGIEYLEYKSKTPMFFPDLRKVWSTRKGPGSV